MPRAIRIVLGATAVLAASLLAMHLWAAFRTRAEVNLVSGVWLTLAIDMRNGVFYRALIGPAGYGGTRYFPLLFTATALVMRMGAGPIAAGQLVSVAGGVLLAAGAFRFLRVLGTPVRHAAAGALLTVVPYFMEQVVAQIRVDPLAAACVMWGGAAVAQRVTERRGTLVGAAAWFAAAFLAKPTAIYAGAAAVAALTAARRFRDAAALAAACVLMWGIIAWGITVLSGGRSLESFRACAFAGQSPLGLLHIRGLADAALRLVPFRVLSITIAAAAATIALRPHLTTSLPSLLLIASLAVAVVTLASPGTIAANQGVDPYVLAVVLIVGTLASLSKSGVVVDVVLTLWLAALCVQNVREFRRLPFDAPGTVPSAEMAVRQEVSACRDPILAESPLVPIVAQRPVTLLDPFAFRVVAMNLSKVEDDLVRRIDSREFGCVVLDHDPLSRAGRGWYRQVSLGGRTIDAILRSYRLRDIVAGYRVYSPAPSIGSTAR